MDLTKYVAAKTVLNNDVHHIKRKDVSLQIHYWGLMPRHYDNQLHKHSFFEICYVVDGEGTYLDEGRTYPLKESTIFFTRPEVLHQIKSTNGISLLYVAFQLDESESTEKWIQLIDEAKNCMEIVLYDQYESESVMLWKSLLIHATKHYNKFSKEILLNIAYCLIFSLLQDFVPNFNDTSKKIYDEKYSTLLTQAQLYIHDNLSSSLKSKEVAKQLHISCRHLSRIFISELGTTFSNYVQNERIKKAVILLKQTDMSIKEIAEETGFKNVQYFTRIFTLVMQMPPGKFRKQFIDQKTITFSD